jgi:hypothetical protein
MDFIMLWLKDPNVENDIDIYLNYLSKLGCIIQNCIRLKVKKKPHIVAHRLPNFDVFEIVLSCICNILVY